MDRNKQNDSGSPPAPNSSSEGSTPNSETSTPTPNQILQESWAASVDAQTAQQFAGLSQIRQARTNQLQRELASLTKAYGSSDPGVQAVQASLQYEQTFGSRLSVVSTVTSTTAPTAPTDGWVVYGRVRNADLSAAPQLTVFLADESRAWLKQYAYTFTDKTGYFTLSYTPTAAGKKSRRAEAKEQAKESESLSAYLEISNAACKVMYVDAEPMAITVGAVIYRDIVLSDEVPLGNPPCEPGASSSTPPASKKK
jgi:hypothetical protein